MTHTPGIAPWVMGLSPLFRERRSPALRLGNTPAKRYLQGIAHKHYEIYHACKGSNPVPVKEVAAQEGRKPEDIHELCQNVEYALDRNILQHDASWARSLVPFGIDLRFFSGATARAERYLTLLTELLPTQNALHPLERAELLGYAFEHLGGVSLHRDNPPRAREAYHHAEIEFNKLLRARRADIPHFRGLWKQRALRSALGVADAMRLTSQFEEGMEIVESLLEEAHGLESQATQSSRSFEYRGHTFRTFIAEVERIQGDLLATVGNRHGAVRAHNRSIRALKQQRTDQEDTNQLVASLVKRAAARANSSKTAERALKDLELAEKNTDPEKETGIYRVFINKTRMIAYDHLGQRQDAIQHARRALVSATRLGMKRQTRLIQAFLSAARRQL